jgi:hypothetical protein
MGAGRPNHPAADHGDITAIFTQLERLLWGIKPFGRPSIDFLTFKTQC